MIKQSTENNKGTIKAGRVNNHINHAQMHQTTIWRALHPPTQTTCPVSIKNEDKATQRMTPNQG